MEVDIIASGFKVSEEMHGLRYTELIGDGDSSVLHTIQTTVLSYGRHFTKVEYANHCVKCYKSRLEQLVKDFPAFKGKGGLTKSLILKLTQGARCAIHKHAQTNDANKLRQDLRSGPSHYLGIHDKCDSSWCSVKASNQPSNKTCNVPSNLLFELERAGGRIVSKAAQLIQDQTTNLSECYISVRAKMDGGKQINRIQCNLGHFNIAVWLLV